MQSKKMSFVESLTNTVLGLGIQAGASLLMFWVLAIQFTGPKFIVYTATMVFLSTARSYILRRLFECKFWVQFRKQVPLSEKCQHNISVDESCHDCLNVPSDNPDDELPPSLTVKQCSREEG